MTNYKWFLFDLDNTILDFSEAAKIAFIETLIACRIENNSDYYDIYNTINHFYWQQYELGKIDANTLQKGRFKDFLKEIKIDFDSDKMSAFYMTNLVSHSIEIPDALSVLDSLKMTKNLALITNGLSDVQHKRIAKHDLSQYFEYIFISDEMGVSKPANAFFEIVHKKIGSPLKNKVVVVGDNPKSDILGATNFGYDSIYFNYSKKDSSKVNATYKINDWNAFK